MQDRLSSLRPSSSDDARRTLLHALPAVIVGVLLLAQFGAYGIPKLGHYYPLIAYSSIFFWSIYKPAALPYSFLFLCGLVHDSFAHYPLGMSSILYMAMRAAIASQGKIIEDWTFNMQWSVFTLAMMLVQMLGWVMIAVHYSAPLSFTPLLISMGITVLLYPLIYQGWHMILRMID